MELSRRKLSIIKSRVSHAPDPGYLSNMSYVGKYIPCRGTSPLGEYRMFFLLPTTLLVSESTCLLCSSLVTFSAISSILGIVP